MFEGVPQRVLLPEDLARTRHALPPHLFPTREEVVPPELANPAEAFGLLHRTIPRAIGKESGPRARILVSRVPPPPAPSLPVPSACLCPNS